MLKFTGLMVMFVFLCCSINSSIITFNIIVVDIIIILS